MPDPVKGGYGTDHGSSTNTSAGGLGAKGGDPKNSVGSGMSPGSSTNTSAGGLGAKGGDPKSSVGSGMSSASDQLSKTAEQARNAASDLASRAGSAAERATQDAKAGAAASTASLRDQAAGVAHEARSTVSAMAEEARHRIAELVDQQKAAGADTVAGVARAAQAAAGDLEKTSPQAARLVRTAAEGVDRVANDIRSSNVNDILGTLTDFGRRQPVAFFGGAVVAGFILARFLKSDVPSAPRRLPYPDARRL